MTKINGINFRENSIFNFICKEVRQQFSCIEGVRGGDENYFVKIEFFVNDNIYAADILATGITIEDALREIQKQHDDLVIDFKVITNNDKPFTYNQLLLAC